MRSILPFVMIAMLKAGSAGATPPPGYFLSLAVYRPASGHVYAYADLGTRTLALNGVFGSSAYAPVVGDFDGNGVYDLALYQAGVWSFDTNHNYSTASTINFGGAVQDIPLAGDFDGDGIADLVIYRSGTWFIRGSKPGNTVTTRTLGGAGDKPIIADFDGDGIPDIAVYQSGTWTIQMSLGNTTVIDHFGGLPDDQPCAADWDHDGRAELCIYRQGIWYFKSVGATDLLDSYAFGGPGDIPLPGGSFDYTGAIYVRAGASGTQDGTPAHPFATITQGVNAAANGAVIRVAGGAYSEAVLWLGPAHAGGKNSLKLLGVDRRAVALNAGSTSNDAFTLVGTTGNVIEGFSIGPPSRFGIQMYGGAGSFSASDPGATLSLAFCTISNTTQDGVFVSGSGSFADVRHNYIHHSQTKSGIVAADLATTATPMAAIVDNEIAFNGYTLASGVDGNGIVTSDSAQFTVTGNYIHDNNRFGINAVINSQFTITGNTIATNQLNGIILCNPANDTTTAQIIGNRIIGNGVNTQNTAHGYNGIEVFQTCIGSQIISGNTFDSNSLNGVFVGGGTATVTSNIFSNNATGMALYVDDNSSTNTSATVYGNQFNSNLLDGLFVYLNPGTSKSVTATVGGAATGQPNSFLNQNSTTGSRGIACNTSAVFLTCPTGGNIFSGNTTDIQSTCPSTCAK